MSEGSQTTGGAAPNKPKREMGIMGIIGVALGGGCLLVAVVGIFNTAFDLNLAFGSYGSSTPLPDSWEVVAGVAAFGVLLIGITFFGSYVTGKFKDAKGKPLVRVGIIAAAVGLLAVVFRGLQIMALVSTYGSMLAYYATDGDLDDVKAELEKGPTPGELDDAVGRAAQYDNAAALELLLAAGANFEDANSDYKSCVLGSSVGVEFFRVAIEGGAKPDNCPEAETLVWELADRGEDDAQTARKIEMLVAAGWSVQPIPKEEKKSALEVAQGRKKPTVVAALVAAGAK